MKKIFLLIVLSFTAFISCKTNPQEQVDEGKIKNSVYTSNEVGWSIKVPSKWNVISRKQNEDYQRKGLKAMEETLDEKISVVGLKNLIGFQKNKFNLFQSTSEPFEVSYEGEWEENNRWVKKVLYTTLIERGIKVDSSSTKVINIDGLDFLSYSFTVYSPKREVILKQIIYNSLINGFDFGANINYNNESDKQEMLDAWLNSKFKK